MFQTLSSRFAPRDLGQIEMEMAGHCAADAVRFETHASQSQQSSFEVCVRSLGAKSAPLTG